MGWIMLVGGSVFLGSNLSEALVSHGWKVLIVDLFTPKFNAAKYSADRVVFAGVP